MACHSANNLTALLTWPGKKLPAQRERWDVRFWDHLFPKLKQRYSWLKHFLECYTTVAERQAQWD